MTTSLFRTGQPGITLAPGDHVCAFYRGRDQRDAVLLPYLREGILAGDKCISVLDDHDVEQVSKPLSLCMDVERARRTGQLDLLVSEEAYLVDGQFRLERMLGFWESRMRAALEDSGYRAARAAGEMTWALRDLPGVQDLIRYEARLNAFLPRYPQVILCLYDLERFCDGEILIGVLRTHPWVLLSGELLENPWYVNPGDAGEAA
jgi:hypothetical protein